VLVVVLGGGIGGLLFAYTGSLAIDRLQHPPRLRGYGTNLIGYRDPRNSIFRIFSDLGITDWRAFFGIGAVLGVGCLVLYLKAGRKVTLATCLIILLVLKLWVLWT